MYAVFGDSYIAWLERYTGGKMNTTFPCNFYGVSGMSTTRKISDEFVRLVKDKPRFVFLNVGGNDITDKCDVDTIVKNIVKISRELLYEGVERVFVASIVERGSFPDWPGMDRQRFNKIRRSVNCKLRRHFGNDFVNLCNQLRFPKHYASDEVHPGFTEGGMKKLRFIIINTFVKTYRPKKK